MQKWHQAEKQTLPIIFRYEATMCYRCLNWIFVFLEYPFHARHELAKKMKEHMCEVKTEINIIWCKQRAAAKGWPVQSSKLQVWNVMEITASTHQPIKNNSSFIPFSIWDTHDYNITLLQFWQAVRSDLTIIIDTCRDRLGLHSVTVNITVIYIYNNLNCVEMAVDYWLREGRLLCRCRHGCVLFCIWFPSDTLFLCVMLLACTTIK